MENRKYTRILIRRLYIKEAVIINNIGQWVEKNGNYFLTF